jgi:4-amino-4-deoxy-L-arabinose transferase-like glycosyltransferase
MTRAALVLLALLTGFRLWYAAVHGLVQDESYYWQWSRRLAPAYFDQGPGIAFLIRIGTSLFGDTSFGVRFMTVLLGAGTGWLIFLTARRWFGATVAFWTVALLNIAPLFAVGAMIANYDGPQVFFWAAALYAVTWTVQENRAAGWYLVGLCVGLSALCKLTGLLFAPCVLAYLLLSPAHRRWLLTPYPYLGFVLALLIFSPVLVWNARNDWYNFQHGAALGSRGRGLPVLRLLGDFLGGQALVLGPLLFLAELGVLGALTARLRDREMPERERFLVAFAAPILLLCLYISLRSKMEANWPAPAHLAGVLAVTAWGVASWNRLITRAVLIPAAVVSLVATVVLLFPVLLPRLGFRVTADLAQKANDTYGWPELLAQVQAARQELEREGKPVFLASINYRLPSLMAFYLPDHPETHGLFLDTRRDQYFIWTKPETLIGQNALVAFDDPNKPESVALLKRYFASVEEPRRIAVYRDGFEGPVKQWFLYLCRDFKGYTPDDHVKGY